MHRMTWKMILVLLAATCVAESAPAQAPAAAMALSRMPVKEVTVFKDGHAFVLHEGDMPTDAAGRVVLDELPTPVVGTFWPYARQEGARLTAVRSARQLVEVGRTALSLTEMLQSNIGAEVAIVERSGQEYSATCLGIPTRSSEELAATSPPGTPPSPPQSSGSMLLKTDKGTRLVPIDQIRDLTFLKEPKRKVACQEFRNTLTLELAWDGGRAGRAAKVGMVYLQKGIRWIPEYRVDIDGKGQATVRLQATLINEMIDLENATVNLVIGVPSFPFEASIDPIALQQTTAQLSSHFQRNSQTAYAFSNAIMTQMAMPNAPAPQAPPAGGDLGPEIGGGSATEDLFVFRREGITLKKGQRMALPIVEFKLPYKDVYTLDIPVLPPPEVRQRLDNRQQEELARLMAAPKVMHKIRLTNTSAYPLTTAPTLILKDGRLLAQGLMTYTPIGAAVDLEVTTAVNMQVTHHERETRREPQAAKWFYSTSSWYWLTRINLSGAIEVVNRSDRPVELEVTRHLLGNVDKADNDGATEHVSFQTDPWSWRPTNYPYWWGWYGWPGWWHSYNGMDTIRWSAKIEPTKRIELKYDWHYFWQQ